MNFKFLSFWGCAISFFIFSNQLNAQVPDGCFPFDISIPPEYGNFPNISEDDCNHDLFRTFNGTYNDLSNIDEGRAGIEFSRLLPAVYAGDGNTMVDRGNPRTISNEIMAQPTSIPSEAGLTSMVFTFLQFIDHDITLVREGEHEFVPIPIPAGDPEYDPFGTGEVIIPFTRDEVESGTGTSAANPRQHENTITAWVDGSVVYGSDMARADWLRSNVGGKLFAAQTVHGPVLPYNTIDKTYDSPVDLNAPRMAGDRNSNGEPQKVFVSGDVRANEQPGLTAFHVLFMKEHNRICDELIASGSTDDEFNYQYARKVVGGLIQNILFTEVLPALGIYFPTDAYDPSLDADISNEFATAAYRLGHTMITDEMDLLFNDCSGNDFVGSAHLPLKEAFFNPTLITDYGIDPILRGLYNQKQETIDEKVVDAARNFLFGPPGAGGMDLAALNIQRGRDHGISDFNSLRQAAGLPALTSFSQITDNQELANKLQSLYSDVNNIDAWVGMLAEKKYNNTPIGETLHEILKQQFEKLLRADRFYFWRDPLLPQDAKMEIYTTKLSDVIMRNTNIDAMQSVFYWQGNCLAASDYCEPAGDDDNALWVERTRLNNIYNPTGDDAGYLNQTNQAVRFQKATPNCFIMESQTDQSLVPSYSKVFIDFDRDGDFEPEEIVFDKFKTRYFSGHIRIPDTVLPGITRIRVVTSPTPIPDGCSNMENGEVEDYTVVIE